MYDNNNHCWRYRTPGTPGTKSHVQIVNNYQSLTIAKKTHIPGVTGRIDPLLNLIVIKNIFNRQFARSRFLGVKFYKVCRGSFREFNFWILTWKAQGIYSFLRIWSYFLKKSLKESFNFWAVLIKALRYQDRCL